MIDKKYEVKIHTSYETKDQQQQKSSFSKKKDKIKNATYKVTESGSLRKVTLTYNIPMVRQKHRSLDENGAGQENKPAVTSVIFSVKKCRVLTQRSRKKSFK